MCALGTQSLDDGRRVGQMRPVAAIEVVRRLGFRQAIEAAEIAAVGEADPQVAQDASLRINEQAGPGSFGGRIGRRRTVGQGRDDFDGAVGADFHVEIISGLGRPWPGGGGSRLHEPLCALLFGAGEEAVANPIQAAGDGELLFELGNLRAQDRQVVELPFQLRLLGHEALELLFQEAFLAFGRGQLAFGVFDLRGQVGDGGAEVDGLLVQRLVLRLQLGDLGVALGGLFLAGFERGLGLGEIIGDLGEVGAER